MQCSSEYSSAIGMFAIGDSAIDLPLALPTYPTLTALQAYLYWQYSDDDDLQAFVAAFNTITQAYLNWFLQLGLPVYTLLNNTYLDWVGRGVYGVERPVLGTALEQFIGPLDTWALNSWPLAEGREVVSNASYSAVDDDTYKRVITWGYYKADGRYIGIQWLKRRVVRFLAGLCGTDPPIDQEYGISVLVAQGECAVRLLTCRAKITGGAMLGAMPLDTFVLAGSTLAWRSIAAPWALGSALAEAVAQGVVETPFQYQTTVQAGSTVCIVETPYDQTF